MAQIGKSADMAKSGQISHSVDASFGERRVTIRPKVKTIKIAVRVIVLHVIL